MLTKQRLDAIKARCEKANWWRQQRGFPNAVHLLIGDIPALLAHIEGVEAESERLREALGEAFKRSTNLSTYKGVTNVVCHMCNTVGIESKGHADDCPFKALEGVKE